jgi:hypothetical protein
MKKRKLATKTAGESSLPELLNRLELALPRVLDRASVDKALSELSTRLGSVGNERPARAGRPAPSRCRRKNVVESLSLFP